MDEPADCEDVVRLGVRDRHSQVGDERAGAALQRHEQGERIALLLPRGAEDARHDLLRGGAPRRAVATTHLAGHDGGPNRLFGLPIRGLHLGAGHTGEECRSLGPQMLEEAAVRRMGDPAGEDAIGVRREAAERHAQPMAVELPAVAPVAQRQRAQEEPAHHMGEPCRPALGGLEQPVRAAQEMVELIDLFNVERGAAQKPGGGTLLAGFVHVIPPSLLTLMPAWLTSRPS